MIFAEPSRCAFRRLLEIQPPHPSKLGVQRSKQNLLPLKVDLGVNVLEVNIWVCFKAQKTWKKRLRPSLSVGRFFFCWWLSVEKTNITSSACRKTLTRRLNNGLYTIAVTRNGNPSFMVTCGLVVEGFQLVAPQKISEFRGWKCWRGWWLPNMCDFLNEEYHWY